MKTGNGREAILLAARDTFARKGYDGASIRDIAQEADLSLSALYYYFKSKQDVLHEVVSHAYRSYISTMGTVLDACGDDAGLQLASAVRYLVNYRVTHTEVSRVVIRDADSLDADHFESVHQLQRDARQLMIDIVDRGNAAGVFATENSVLAARSILAMCNAIPLWYQSGGALDAHDLEVSYVGYALRLVGFTQAEERGEYYFSLELPDAEDAD
ncbi:TetR family transcriptional regulator [Brevibacterium sp. 50QC2O2]|uniref:TetR family transcriptional regulator n=1 Tax=Brevibacterium TaxID=1696 RepID=UPI00211BE0E5|nr:TetR family transcriptional regulator [Brevibacterium sp. 91QC2O2]MCQ9386699.1 TetR family transcriptional regulator [Brevibacterium sp. 68QC2CO]MCQ9389347.1 TetR family transcriptional regulator [Brevibacterium sp. 50QC2O2]